MAPTAPKEVEVWDDDFEIENRTEIIVPDNISQIQSSVKVSIDDIMRFSSVIQDLSRLVRSLLESDATIIQKKQSLITESLSLIALANVDKENDISSWVADSKMQIDSSLKPHNLKVDDLQVIFKEKKQVFELDPTSIPSLLNRAIRLVDQLEACFSFSPLLHSPSTQ